MEMLPTPFKQGDPELQGSHWKKASLPLLLTWLWEELAGL